MAVQSRTIHRVLYLVTGVGLGPFFTFIVGDISSPHYLLELMSLILVEVPFVAAYALLVRKCGRTSAIVCGAAGTLLSMVLIGHGLSLTPVIFLKIAATGVILGEISWFAAAFPKRLSAVAAPGILFAFLFGIPLVIQGVSPEVLEEIRNDSLGIYQTLMSEDDARNAIERAMYFFQGVFRIGLSVYVLYAVMLAWFSMYFSGWLLGVFREQGGYPPPFQSFRMPFHSIWALLAGAGLWVAGIESVYPFALNILAVMAGLYGVQGLAIVMYHMNGISIGRLPKVLFWVIFFLTIGLTGVLLVITGIIDTWFNLRSVIYQNADKEEGNKDENHS